MRVNAVSMTQYPAVSKKSAQGSTIDVQNPKQPSFGYEIYKMPGNINSIKNIWVDGPKLFQIAEETWPIIKKNFEKFFDVSMDFHVDLARTIRVNLHSSFNKQEELIKHITKFNDSTFHFPKEVIKNLNNGQDTKWLEYEYFFPLTASYEKLGFQKTRDTILDFANRESNNTLIKKLYKINPPDGVPGEKIPEYYWSCPGW